MEKEFSNEDLVQFYTERLQNTEVSSAAALKKAAEEGDVDLSLDISKKVSAEKQRDIVKNNPDSVGIGEKTYDIAYSYDSFYRKHKASIAVPVEEIFEVETVPTIPSGRTIYIKITDASYERFSGEDLEELKSKAEEHLLAKQWEAFRHSPDAPKEQKLKEFDPITGTLPELPELITFGTNPRTQEPALAHPALTYKKPYWSEDTAYTVLYYKTEVEAQKAQEQALAQIEAVKEERRKEEERQELLAPAKTAFSEVENLYSQIEDDYGSFGLSWSEMSELRSLFTSLRYEIQRDPKSVLDKVKEIKSRVASAYEIKEKKNSVAKRVDELITEEYSNCPLCGGDLSDGACRSNNHQIETVQFDTNEYGREISPALLSQIKVVTEEGDKIVARLMCSAGTGRRYFKGNVYLEKGSNLEYYERWDGQPGDVVFEDFGRIMTPEEKRSKLEESQRSLPEGVFKVGDAVDQEGAFVYAQKNDGDGQWRLVSILTNGSVSGYKGFRSKSAGSSPEQLIRDYYRGYPDMLRRALAEYAASKTEAPLDDSPMAAAFKKATGTTNPTQIASSFENDEDTGELTGWKRRKLEEQVEETETKITYRQAELHALLQREKSTALDVSSGETETEISKPGVKIIAVFDKTDESGNHYAEVLEWPKDRLLRLQAQGLEGQQYVEIVEPVEDGDFYEEGLGLAGITLKVKNVDLSENDEVIKTQQDKLRKLRRRIDQ
jgi:hypothetical protein